MKNTSERGGALLLCVVITLIVLGISAAFLSFSGINSKKTSNDMFGLQALYIADSGAAMFIHQINRKTAPLAPQSLATGTVNTLAGGSYVYPTAGFINYGANGIDDDLLNGPDDTYEQNFIRFQVDATYAGVTRKLEVMLTRAAGGVYWNAVFAGNVSNSPYDLHFGGTVLNNGDLVRGDIYSGGTFSASGTAQLQSDTGAATGSVVMSEDALGTGPGGPTYKQGTQENLAILRPDSLNPNQTTWERDAILKRSGINGVGRDINGVSYFDVAYDLSTKGDINLALNKGGAQSDQAVGSNAGLGRAGAQILNSAEPSHIFRKNPTAPNSNNDRTTSYAYVNTAKDDYYIEDPTHSGVNNISNLGYDINGSTRADGVYISPNGNNAVYFVDGNLWVSHNSLKTYQWVKPAGMAQMKVTIVVKGNVSFTDNLVYATKQSDNDAVAILAINDSNYLNKTGSAFAVPDPNTSLLKTGLTVTQFVNDFNARAAAAGTDTTGKRKIANLDLSTPAGRERAASEYNRAHGSGNVFYGDPGSGTVEYFEAFMYAESDFYATNLDSTLASGGTQRVEIFGNMTAGNQVQILRDATKVGYIPLKVSFDDRIKLPNGVKPPALPGTPGFGNGDWLIASWKVIP